MKPNELLSSTGETYEYARLYIQQQVDYLRLETARRIALTTSSLVTSGIIGMLSLMIILFMSLALGFYLGEILDSNALAFLTVGMIYLVITGLIIFFKRTIITNPILEMVIKNMLD